MKTHLSWTELFVISLTIMLFIVALFVKGLTKDLLLEAGVLLVSVKLIIMNHKSAEHKEKIVKDLEEIKQILFKMEHEERENKTDKSIK